MNHGIIDFSRDTGTYEEDAEDGEGEGRGKRGRGRRGRLSDFRPNEQEKEDDTISLKGRYEGPSLI